ncbi:toprim domain-containing protein [Mycobacteroides abscessus]|uniref:toprim domain-containing protein n=1 Tax=Mycobacteroides abscessus TaxID=36809 RepID=UPI001F260966|nr:toprim domain-containing protein [Mycobacteroides abscessus]
MTVAGDRPRLYNTLSLWKGAEKVAITEGELDAIAAESCGIRAVGVPGATSWQRYFREPFLGYQTVYILADGDDAGMQFANTVASDLPNARIVPMPKGSDVNDFVLREGREALKDRLK